MSTRNKIIITIILFWAAYNQFHNILRLLDVLSNFPFATSETMGDYYLKTWYLRVTPRVAKRLKT